MAPYFGLTGTKLHAAIWAESCVSIAIFGYATASAGGVLNIPSFRKQFPLIDVTDAPENEKHRVSLIQGFALYTLLGVFGALACTFLGDRLGRRLTIFIAAGIVVIGALLMATSYSFAQFVVARIVLGLGVGGIVATVPVWQSELSRAESRGSHVSSFGIFCGTGLSLALWISFGMSFTSGSVSWRFPLCFSGALAIIVMCFIFKLPESPRWLKLRDRHDEARQVLERLHPGDPDIVEKEIEDIELALRISVDHVSLLSMFSMGPQRLFHRVMLACVVQIMLQFTGVNAIAFYTPTIYASQLHFPAVEAGALAAASQACLILGGIMCAFTVDRFGRRPLMMFSAAAMSICFVCVTALTSQPNNQAASKAAVFFLFLYYVVYTVGYIGIPFLYASEVAPVQLRAAVCGLSTAISWLFNFLVCQLCRILISPSLTLYSIVYTVLNATFVPIVYFFYPETAGRSLEEIDAIFTGSKSIFDTVKVANKMPKMHLTDVGYERKAEEAERVDDTKDA
ncbi:MFS1 putative major facilitator superfamily transporter [Massarina eburnea CBS 473.64]|uniref:MFS1 putative major facilitator superfamily transporter n=1 Tax=Massarina eburnea CBS 473.64 TaxID=1395130 RepID=A0A6A6SEV0_9PLEO|nr:MFS1 putative major facilitator superfamily transporter [Massarina eburnea CBS 473.64]